MMKLFPLEARCIKSELMKSPKSDLLRVYSQGLKSQYDNVPQGT